MKFCSTFFSVDLGIVSLAFCGCATRPVTEDKNPHFVKPLDYLVVDPITHERVVLYSQLSKNREWHFYLLTAPSNRPAHFCKYPLTTNTLYRALRMIPPDKSLPWITLPSYSDIPNSLERRVEAIGARYGVFVRQTGFLDGTPFESLE